MTAPRPHDSRFFATAGPDECSAYHGGYVGYWLCELARGHSGSHRDTQDDGRVWVWRGMEEIASCLPECNRDLTGHFEHGATPIAELHLTHPDLDFHVDVNVHERNGRYIATAGLGEDSRDVGTGDTPQEAVKAALRSLGDAYASEMVATAGDMHEVPSDP